MMKFLFVLAALCAAALSAPGATPYGTPGGCTTYFNLPVGTVKTFGDNTDGYWCLQYSMIPSGSNYAYTSLRRHTRFNNSGSYLFFCSGTSITTVDYACTSVDSSYSFYSSTSLSTVYGRIDLKTYGTDIGSYVSFDMKNFVGSSASSWSGYCPQGNCDSRGACFSGSCDCDYGHSTCDVSGLLDWIIYLIVVCVIVVIVIPIVIIICCCCCGVCCAAAAAAH